MPDYFVPLDTTKFTVFHRKLMAKNIIMDTFLKYVDNNRKELKKDYKTFESFKKQYEVPTSLTNQIIAEAKKEKIEPKDSDELKKTLDYMRYQLKSLVARDLWDMTEYFQIWNEQSDIVKKALEVIEKDSNK